jgi:serine hydrolase
VDVQAEPGGIAASFITPDLAPIGVPGLVVSSDDDPYCTPRAAQRLARGWTVGHVSVGRAGHVNQASGLGAWRSGQALLGAFLAGLGHP